MNDKEKAKLMETLGIDDVNKLTALMAPEEGTIDNQRVKA